MLSKLVRKGPTGPSGSQSSLRCDRPTTWQTKTDMSLGDDMANEDMPTTWQTKTDGPCLVGGGLLEKPEVVGFALARHIVQSDPRLRGGSSAGALLDQAMSLRSNDLSSGLDGLVAVVSGQGERWRVRVHARARACVCVCVCAPWRE